LLVVHTRLFHRELPAAQLGPVSIISAEWLAFLDIAPFGWVPSCSKIMSQITPLARRMPRYKHFTLTFTTALALALSSAAAIGATMPTTEQDRSPAALQSRLDQAESSFRSGNLQQSIDQARSLLNVNDSSFFQSDEIAQQAKGDLGVFQLKAGNADQTAKLVRELSMAFQIELQMDPKYQTDPVQVLAGAPAILKDYFSKVIDRLHETSDTKLKIESIIDNTYPKNYAAQLKTFFSRQQTALKQLAPLDSIANSEELRYIDQQTPLTEGDADNASNPQLSTANLEKIARTLDALATQAQQLPVGDLQAAHGLYTLALLANSAQHYPQAETFARQALAHTMAMAGRVGMVDYTQFALAYSLLKQGKTEAFKSLINDLLQQAGDHEPTLVSLARLTQFSGDKSGAADIYKRALDNRAHKRMTSPPDWMDNYNQLLKELGGPGTH
jgi:hypothetical protein